MLHPLQAHLSPALPRCPSQITDHFLRDPFTKQQPPAPIKLQAVVPSSGPEGPVSLGLRTPCAYCLHLPQSYTSSCSLSVTSPGPAPRPDLLETFTTYLSNTAERTTCHTSVRSSTEVRGLSRDRKKSGHGGQSRPASPRVSRSCLSRLGGGGFLQLHEPCPPSAQAPTL